jgi:hypothetical protein
VLSAPGHTPRPADLRLAQALAELATIGILSQRELVQSRRLARQLQRALDSRVVIEQAKGAVSAWLGVTPAEAFGLLRSYARARSRPLPQVAGDVLDGATPVGSLVAGGRRARGGPQRRAGADDGADVGQCGEPDPAAGCQPAPLSSG